MFRRHDIFVAARGRPAWTAIGLAEWLMGVPFSALLSLARWEERWRQRQDLAELSTERLEDLGLSREDVARESRKPFWRA
jgi:uncharacterized protein YjiS (DUF1127 family)